MKLDYLDLCGFRGYRNQVRIEFADRFTVIDGRNGVGKSTIFDAIEFALTGQLSKYQEAKASGESVADYIWWTGGESPPMDRYVEVGFRSGDERVAIRRKQIGEPDTDVLHRVQTALCDPLLSPAAPLKQLCSASIIRDEHITNLSLDLKETDRYALLRDALGANDASDWTSRAAEIVAVAKKRTGAAQLEVGEANVDLATASRRLDEVRASLVSEATIGDATARLQDYLGSKLPGDQLSGPVRERIALQISEIQGLQAFAEQLSRMRADVQRLPALAETLAATRKTKEEAGAALLRLPKSAKAEGEDFAADVAVDLISLLGLGRKLGLSDGHCPLCEQPQSAAAFDEALQRVEALAHRLNTDAAKAAQLKRDSDQATARLAAADRADSEAEAALKSVQRKIDEVTVQAVALRLSQDVRHPELSARMQAIRVAVDAAEKDLRVLDTLRLNVALERAQKGVADAKARVARAQDRFGKARRVETGAQALHDASRRAASETLDRRLERVLPLMSELYRRLRPHPVWNDIEYSIRGDVRRFLKLQVGGDLNPQFLFSSGQRRATGLAFLLSVNLSLAWSRWRTILLDDPVQHVDDFRSVHLAELLAQVVAGGRQVICAVEDVALADMLARRLPVRDQRSAKRITLGPDSTGALTKQEDRFLAPHPRRVLAVDAHDSGQAA